MRISVKVALVILLLVGLALLMADWIHSASCKLAAEPKAHPTGNPIASSDFKALVSFVGHLNYSQQANGNSFLPLEVQRASLARRKVKVGEETYPASVLSLHTNCSTVGFMQAPWGARETLVVQIQVDLARANLERHQCTINIPFNVVSHGLHYVCKQPRVYNCHAGAPETTPVIVQLHIVSLEFELDGDEKTIRSGKFSSAAQECS